MADTIRVGIVGATVTSGGQRLGCQRSCAGITSIIWLRVEGGLYRACGDCEGLSREIWRTACVSRHERNDGASGY